MPEATRPAAKRLRIAEGLPNNKESAADDTVPAAEFARNFGRYKLLAKSRHVEIYFSRVRASSTTVSHVVMRDQSISFHVSRLGVPVLVKISYYPRWHALGAVGPYRVSPNLMVVVPTSHNVSLVYGATSALTWGNVISDFVVLCLVVALWRRRGWRRPHHVTARVKH